MMMKQQLILRIEKALKSLEYPSENIQVQAPRHPEHGDFATNTAMKLTGTLKRPPLDIADAIVSTLLRQDSDGFFKSVDTAPPGFINFKINQGITAGQLPYILAANQKFGRSSVGYGKRALVEFVSANPTGPLTVGHGRGAMLGDTISNILEWNGFTVQREYYFNNAGRQMRLLAQSVYARYCELCGKSIEFPEDGYQGHYIRDIAKSVYEKYHTELADHPDDPVFRDSAEAFIFTDIKRALGRLGLTFDTFFNEHELYENQEIDRILERLEEQQLTFSKDGALWLKATRLGRESDKVLVKSSGEPTYRLPDMAYHVNKFDRGFDLIVDVFGTDHIDTFPDILAVLKTLGYDESQVRVLIHQFVTIIKNGEQVKMSTRKANFVTLDELTDEVGADVVRYFFLMRGMNSHLNFDLNLAKDQSDENPVYYLQYAHARLCNILKRAEALEIELDESADLNLLTLEEELSLTRKLLEFPNVIKKALETLEPQQIINYLNDTAAEFHRYYAHFRVISDDAELTSARLVLVQACQITLRNGLNVLGITAPERM